MILAAIAIYTNYDQTLQLQLIGQVSSFRKGRQRF